MSSAFLRSTKSIEEQAIENRQQPTIVSVCLNCKKGICVCAFSCKEERRILFPFEENEDDSKSALRYILKHIHREGDEIIFLHVVPTSYRRAYHDTMVVGLKPESEIEWREKCADFVERVFIPILKDKNAKRNRLEMVSYDPSERSVGEVIVRKSEEHDVCFIFMFAHHKSRLHEFFLGSCANYVLHRSSKPVMLFKREENKETQELE